MSKKKLKKLNRNHKIGMTVQGLNEIRMKAAFQAVQVTNYFPLFVLRDKFNLGNKRLQDFQKSYVEMWRQYNEDEINIDSIAKEIRAVSGIDFPEAKDTKHLYPNKPNNHKVQIKRREIDQVRKHARDDAFTVTSYIPLYVLRTQYGFGKVRLKRFYDHYLELWDSYLKGYLTLDDIAKTLEDEVNITWVEEE